MPYLYKRYRCLWQVQKAGGQERKRTKREQVSSASEADQTQAKLPENSHIASQKPYVGQARKGALIAFRLTKREQ
jgi:hypothetical protein